MPKKKAGKGGKPKFEYKMKTCQDIIVDLREVLDDEVEDNAVKFDSNERGWSPAGARVRKALNTAGKMIRVARKWISEEKKKRVTKVQKSKK